MNKFNEGDWVYHDFKLCQVKRVEEGAVREVSTGYISMSSLELECFPLTINNKLISEEFNQWSDKLHKLSGGLNYPDIRRWMVSLWIQTIQAGDDMDAVRGFYDQLRKFCEEIIDRVKGSGAVMVDGVKLFR